jgi:hypothetical protein
MAYPVEIDITFKGKSYPVITGRTLPFENFKKFILCDQCRMSFYEDETIMFRGKVYCRPNGCYHDIAGTLLSERDARRLAAQREYNDGRFLGQRVD